MTQVHHSALYSSQPQHGCDRHMSTLHICCSALRLNNWVACWNSEQFFTWSCVLQAAGYVAGESVGRIVSSGAFQVALVGATVFCAIYGSRAQDPTSAVHFHPNTVCLRFTVLWSRSCPHLAC